ncbi:MAG: hypothetical protein CFE33_03205 [Pseudorhodobacter sp. PARRP1]|nr:MAG: hypothetical protein CFE33_03205 [Pseudorhodobacter sp. PARRP1]
MLALISLAVRLSCAHAMRRMAQASVLFAAALICAIIALTGFAAALAIWLAHLLGPIGAALLIGGIGLVLALVFLLLARSRARTASPLQSPAAQALMAELQRTSPIDLLAPAVFSAILGAIFGGKAKE